MIYFLKNASFLRRKGIYLFLKTAVFRVLIAHYRDICGKTNIHESIWQANIIQKENPQPTEG